MQHLHVLAYTCIVLVIAACHAEAADSRDVVNIMSVSTQRQYLVGKSAAHEPVYIDRAYAIKDMPRQLKGFTLLRTANDDDQVSAAEHLKLPLQQAAIASTENAGDSSDETATIEFYVRPGEVVITAGGHPLATYYYADPQITRPYLAHVHAPDGVQVTRNHPPQLGDPGDHADYHPGIFLAFGDISGHDYWRLKAKVVHAGFLQRPQSHGNRGSFVVRNRYLSTDGSQTICVERCKLTFVAQSGAYRIGWESSFSSSDRDFYFGDQEEMGLGVRVATAICEEGGNGRLLSSEGLETAKQTWGQPAWWCDYAGTIAGEHAGVTIMAAPYNVRPSWWHNRDYGVFVANLFGRRAMKQGGPSKLEVKRGETFRLGYGILLHASRDSQPDLDKAYKSYTESLRSE